MRSNGNGTPQSKVPPVSAPFSKQLQNSPDWQKQLASLGALDAGFVHEINNPLGAIMIIAQNALEQKDSTNPSELLESTCNKVLVHAERCAHIIKGMLQFPGQGKSKKQSGDLNAIVQYAFELTCELRGESFRKPDLNLADDLPAILVNSVEIEQVLVNLIKNAYQAGSRKVTVSTFTSSNGVELCIEDNGRGISPQALKHIFDPFYTTRTHEGGSGLGLAIIHGIIRDHAAEMTVSSKVDKGTKISILFRTAESYVSAKDDALFEEMDAAYG